MSLRRTTLMLVSLTLLCGLAYGVGWASAHDALPWSGDTESSSNPTAAGTTVERSDKPGADAESTDGADGQSGAQASEESETTGADKQPGAQTPGTTTPSTPKLTAGPTILGPNDSGPQVRELQARLKQIDWFHEDVTDFYGPVTTTAVRGFQAKREIPVTGAVDQRTMDRLHAMTRTPTQAELTNKPPAGTAGNTPGAADPRCLTGRALCVDKSSRTLRWMVDGEVLKTVDVRFGSEELPTREGAFSVARMEREHISSIYHTSMPYAMFFSGGQAVHYSPDFAANGYNGASHGCVNVRDSAAIAWIFDQVRLGDKVIVYWS